MANLVHTRRPCSLLKENTFISVCCYCCVARTWILVRVLALGQVPSSGMPLAATITS
jgi:hypothetical protein